MIPKNGNTQPKNLLTIYCQQIVLMSGLELTSHDL